MQSNNITRIKKFWLVVLFVAGFTLGFLVNREKASFLKRIVENNNQYTQSVVNALFEMDMRKEIRLDKTGIELLISLIP